jgi:hypothetical protein
MILLALNLSAQEERPLVNIRNVDITEPKTPVYSDSEGEDTLQITGMLQTSGNSEKWFRIVAEFETRPEWLDRLTLEYYVLLPSRDGKEVLFKGIVNYVDIPEGRDHISDMYLHFNTYKRYYKRGGVDYAVIALVDGKIVSMKTNKKEPENWWKEISPHPCGLLNRLDTPFRVFNVESYQADDLCTWQ